MSETDDTLIFMSKPTRTLNKYSSQITQPKAQGASQAMLYATGLTERDMSKPQVGISSIWYEGNSCNMHLLKRPKMPLNSIGIKILPVSD